MKKKATVLLVLISLCLIVTAGIGAVSASGEAPCGVTTVFKINPDGTTTVVETFEGYSPMVVMVTQNEDGSIDITKEDRQISEEERRHSSNAYKGITITPETELPVNIVNENFSLTADVLKPYEKIDASARTLYYKATAWNYCTVGCYAISNDYDLGTGAQSWDSRTYCYLFRW